MTEKILQFLVSILERIILGWRIMNHDNRLSWILSLLFILGLGFIMFLGLNFSLLLIINLI